MLLNATPFAFVIDLACLASRREYLKLDKWLNDKIREHRVSYYVFIRDFPGLGAKEIVTCNIKQGSTNSFAPNLFLVNKPN